MEIDKSESFWFALFVFDSTHTVGLLAAGIVGGVRQELHPAGFDFGQLWLRLSLIAMVAAEIDGLREGVPSGGLRFRKDFFGYFLSRKESNNITLGFVPETSNLKFSAELLSQPGPAEATDAVALVV